MSEWSLNVVTVGTSPVVLALALFLGKMVLALGKEKRERLSGLEAETRGVGCHDRNVVWMNGI